MNEDGPELISGTGALRALADALDALERARDATTQGFADDYCGNAIREVKKAIRVEAEALTGGEASHYTAKVLPNED